MLYIITDLKYMLRSLKFSQPSMLNTKSDEIKAWLESTSLVNLIEFVDIRSKSAIPSDTAIVKNRLNKGFIQNI